MGQNKIYEENLAEQIGQWLKNIATLDIYINKIEVLKIEPVHEATVAHFALYCTAKEAGSGHLIGSVMVDTNGDLIGDGKTSILQPDPNNPDWTESDIANIFNTGIIPPPSPPPERKIPTREDYSEYDNDSRRLKAFIRDSLNLNPLFREQVDILDPPDPFRFRKGEPSLDEIEKIETSEEETHLTIRFSFIDTTIVEAVYEITAKFKAALTLDSNWKITHYHFQRIGNES